MTEEELTQVYETLAPMAGDYMNTQAEQIGQAQASVGPLAQQVMGNTTAGLGNYTYNRLMRPQVDVMKDELLVKGYTNQLNQLLSDALNNAKKNYEKRKGGNGGGGGGTTTPDKFTIEDEIVDPQKTSTGDEQKLYLSGAEAYNLTIGDYNRMLGKSELEGISGRPMSDANYEIYKLLYQGKYKEAQRKSIDLLNAAGGE